MGGTSGAERHSVTLSSVAESEMSVSRGLFITVETSGLLFLCVHRLSRQRYPQQARGVGVSGSPRFLP